MVEIIADEFTTKIIILGHGLAIAERFELSSGITLEPDVPKVDIAAASTSVRNFGAYAAVVTGGELATFSIEVQGGTVPELVTKAWNSLWLFHLLSLACSGPCYSLCAIARGKTDLYSAANRNVILRPLPLIVPAASEQIAWARSNLPNFYRLTSEPSFSSAMRCYGNAHYLSDLDTRIMLLWAGIEGLLSVDAELNRRLALYAAILHKGSTAEKIAYFNEVKKAYAIRSRAVHGRKATAEALGVGYQASSNILVGLLVRCVELGRVPSTDELDALAVSQSLA